MYFDRGLQTAITKSSKNSRSRSLETSALGFCCIAGSFQSKRNYRKRSSLQKEPLSTHR